MQMDKKVLEFIDENKMLDNVKNVIVGVSGGADSVSLLILLEPICRKRDIGLTVAHINHGIRKTALRDEEYVKSLCEKLGIRFCLHTCNIHRIAEERHISVEEAGRQERYGFFKKLSEGKENCVTAVAHNANDNAETILFNLMRGSGLKGLCGIRPVNNGIIRPLLSCERDEIENFLNSRNIRYMTDETNLTLDYSRNVIRNVILANAKESINPAVVQNINRAGELALQVCGFVESEADKALETVMICRPDREAGQANPGKRAVADSDKLLELPKAVREEVIRRIIEMTCHNMKDITAKHIRSVAELLTLQSGRQVSLPYSLKVRNSYSRLIFDIESDVKTDDGQDEKEVSKKELNEGGELRISFLGRMFYFRLIELENASETDKYFIKKQIEEKNNYTKCLDYDKIKGNIFLRTRQEGDYITIEGGMKKKLKKYFSDIKLDRELRDEVVLIAEASSIIFAIPYRAGSSYYTDSGTKRVLVIREET